VKVLAPEPGSSDRAEQWEPKAGFHALAARYRQAADEPDPEPERVERRPESVALAHHRPAVALSSRLGIVFAGATVAMIILSGLPWQVLGLPLDEYDRTAHALRAVLTALALGGIALAACRWLDRRPARELGIATGGVGRKVALGAAAWFVPAALAYAACTLLGLVRIDLVVSPIVLLTAVGTQIVLVLLLEALPEELMFAATSS